MPAPSGIPERLVDALTALAGSHPGHRPAHAKGIVCRGTFRASPDAQRVSRAEHLRAPSVPVVARFSNASGDPAAPDGLPSARALSTKFQLEGGRSADILAHSIEGFVARTPEELLAFLETQLPEPATGQPRPDALGRFLEGHPASKAFIDRLMQRPVPASYAQATYHAVHAFRFTAADGASCFGRYRLVPEAGESFLSAESAAQRAPDFLREELVARFGRGPIAFQLMLQIAADGDPIDDPTALWPASRPERTLGRLELQSVSPTSGADERQLIFDPGNVVDGIEPSADPILLARSPAYSISYERRQKG
jgi:catalase